MWFNPGITSVHADLLVEMWLCAHLVVLHRRQGQYDEAQVRLETYMRVKDSLRSLSEDEWGQETVMAWYQRATDAALSLDQPSLQWACEIAGARPAR